MKKFSSNTTERIHKFIAKCGIASRRKAEEMILAGRVVVNDKPAAIGQRVNPSFDVIKIDGREIKPRKEHIYVILNKPKGIVTTSEDELGRRTVLDLLKTHINLHEHRLFPVGRLDKDSCGLVFLTDDGETAYRLMHPKEKIPKVYIVKVKGHPSNTSLRELEKGVRIEGLETLPCETKIIKRGDSWTKIMVTLYEGKKRQIRRMMKLINHTVIHLERIVIGPLKLNKLKRGSFHILTENEVEMLKKYLKLKGGEGIGKR